MTQPRTPGEAITTAAQRIAATRDASRKLAEEIAAQRQAPAEDTAPPATTPAP